MKRFTVMVVLAVFSLAVIATVWADEAKDREILIYQWQKQTQLIMEFHLSLTPEQREMAKPKPAWYRDSRSEGSGGLPWGQMTEAQRAKLYWAVAIGSSISGKYKTCDRHYLWWFEWQDPLCGTDRGYLQYGSKQGVYGLLLGAEELNPEQDAALQERARKAAWLLYESLDPEQIKMAVSEKGLPYDSLYLHQREPFIWASLLRNLSSGEGLSHLADDTSKWSVKVEGKEIWLSLTCIGKGFPLPETNTNSHIVPK